MGTLIALFLLVLAGAFLLWFFLAKYFGKVGKFAKKLSKPFFEEENAGNGEEVKE